MPPQSNLTLKSASAKLSRLTQISLTSLNIYIGVVLILMLVVLWCYNICLVVFYFCKILFGVPLLCSFDFSNLVKISFPTRPTRET